jgi:hypothetical protein
MASTRRARQFSCHLSFGGKMRNSRAGENKFSFFKTVKVQSLLQPENETFNVPIVVRKPQYQQKLPHVFLVETKYILYAGKFAFQWAAL